MTIQYGTLYNATLADSMRLYIEHGIEPGSFLQAVLSNNLVGAVGSADHWNKDRIPELVTWIYNNAPETCWGSREAYNRWVKAKSKERKDAANENQDSDA